MAEEIARKLRDIQAWLTDHGARLDAHASALEDHTTRIITLEETVAGLIIPRRLPIRSSLYEYKVYAEPVVGTPLMVQVKAETDKEAIKKAEKMFNTQLVKSEILSKRASKKSSDPQRYWVVVYRRRRPRGLRVRIPEGYEELSPSSQIFCDICGDITVAYKPIKVEFPDKSKLVINVCLGCWNRCFEKKSRKLRVARLVKTLTESPRLNPSRWVLEMYPLDVLAWRRSLIELAGKPLTPSEARLVHSFDDYLSRKGYLTSRQIEVLGEIARRHDVELPALPEVVVR